MRFLHLFDLTPKSEIVALMEIPCSGNLPCISGHSQFLHNPIRIIKVLVFDRFLNFLENYPPISDILGSNLRFTFVQMRTVELEQ